MGKYKCYKCGNDYETSEIRFTGQNRYSCVYCLGLKTRPIEGAIKETKKPTIQKEDMVNYQCSACNYDFKRKKGFEFKSCPYCNKEGTVIMKRSEDANKILKESTDKRFEF